MRAAMRTLAGRFRDIVRKLGKKPEVLLRTNGWVVVFTVLAIATVVAAGFFRYMANPNANIALTYVLAVFVVARSTDGYRYGLAASLAGVVFVNYLFTYPFWALNFTMTGYPITFVAMFTISTITSAMTTNMKEQAQALQEREKQLMEADKEKMRANLLRAISHDLRTPLTSIIGSATLYLEHENGMEQCQKRDLVNHILEDSNWLLNMVENLLSVTRINNDTARVTKTAEPVEEVVGEAVARLKKRLPDARVEVRVPDEVIMAPMDAILIEQVLINLMENAAVHSHSGEPVECAVDEKDGRVLISVRDYGIGIEEERLNNIFDGTSAVQTEAADGRKGMGIGLSICKTIIAAHEGELTVENAEPGARFSFTLPGARRL